MRRSIGWSGVSISRDSLTVGSREAGAIRWIRWEKRKERIGDTNWGMDDREGDRSHVRGHWGRVHVCLVYLLTLFVSFKYGTGVCRETKRKVGGRLNWLPCVLRSRTSDVKGESVKRGRRRYTREAKNAGEERRSPMRGLPVYALQTRQGAQHWPQGAMSSSALAPPLVAQPRRGGIRRVELRVRQKQNIKGREK